MDGYTAPMIAHTSVSVADYEKSKELYAAMLAPLGYALKTDIGEYKVAGYAQGGKTDFWIAEKGPGPGVHVAFMASGKDAVQAFFDAAIEAGATDNGAPGFRAEYSPEYYAAFVHDLDGNNIEAVWMDLPE